MAESCTCVLAFRLPVLTPKPDPDHFMVQVSVSIGAVPSNRPQFKFSPKILHTLKTTFRLPRAAFLLANPAEPLAIISNIFDQLTIPFPLRENILWGVLDFPTENRLGPTSLNLDEIKSRLLESARACANDEKSSILDIRVQKIDKLTPDEYNEKLLGERRDEGQGPLDRWIRENENDVRMHEPWCLGVLKGVSVGSSAKNKCFGMRSVRVLGGDGCSICLKGLEGLESIRMPCGHEFHGFCILRWVSVNPSCPFCRSRLCGDGVLWPVRV